MSIETVKKTKRMRIVDDFVYMERVSKLKKECLNRRYERLRLFLGSAL